MGTNELNRALTELLAAQRVQILADVTGIISPLLTTICGEMPDPLRIADKLDELHVALSEQSNELRAQTAARFASLLASTIRENAGAPPRSNG